VGTVLAITPAGHVVARAPGPEVVPEGTPVVAARGELKGRVSRVFGPVAHPYLSVRTRRAPSPAEAVTWIGATLVRA
jgi:rRNA processing protein Gar1